MPHLISRHPDQQSFAAPLLFVHGMSMDAHCWSTYFLDYFAQHGFAAYALSLRGHEPARGWMVLNPARIRHYVNDLVGVIAGFPEPPILIGHSMGAHVVQKYLEKRSAPASILMAPVPPHGGWQTGLRMIRMHGPGILRDVVTLRRNVLLPTAEQLRAQCFSDAAPDALIEEVLGQIHLESIPAIVDMLLLDLPRPARIRGRLPLLVIGGDADALFSPAEMQKTARALDAEIEMFPGMAHNLMQDVGWQGVAERMLAWLRGLPG